MTANHNITWVLCKSAKWGVLQRNTTFLHMSCPGSLMYTASEGVSVIDWCQCFCSVKILCRCIRSFTIFCSISTPSLSSLSVKQRDVSSDFVTSVTCFLLVASKLDMTTWHAGHNITQHKECNCFAYLVVVLFQRVPCFCCNNIFISF